MAIAELKKRLLSFEHQSQPPLEAFPDGPLKFIRQRGVRAGRNLPDRLPDRAAVVIKPVSALSLCKTGIFAEKAADFRRFPVST
jgi:hypothetical protein